VAGNCGAWPPARFGLAIDSCRASSCIVTLQKMNVQLAEYQYCSYTARWAYTCLQAFSKHACAVLRVAVVRLEGALPRRVQAASVRIFVGAEIVIESAVQ
jgi:hypothetical protein